MEHTVIECDMHTCDLYTGGNFLRFPWKSYCRRAAGKYMFPVEIRGAEIHIFSNVFLEGYISSCSHTFFQLGVWISAKMLEGVSLDVGLAVLKSNLHKANEKFL